MDKLKELVSIPVRKSNHSALDGQGAASLNLSTMISDPAVARYQQAHSQLGMFTHDPAFERELIDSINQVYFSVDEDASRREILKFLEASDSMDAEGMRQRVEQLKRQHKAVAKRVSELVLQKHPDYAQELQRVMQLQRSLLEAFKISKAARMSLRTAAHTNLHSSIKVLLCRRRQHRLQSLEATLGQTRALCNADKRLKDLLEEENFAAAIQLCQECQKAAALPMYRGLACVKELAAKLQDTVVMTEESLDQAMCRMAASGFNYTLYDRIQKAYSLLGKSQSAFDQLHMHFTSTLHNAAFQIVLGYTQLGSSTTAENFQRQQYQQLCSQLPPELYLPCLSDLCKSVWEILKNFYQVLQYHHANNASSASTGPDQQQQQQLSSSAAAYLTQKLAQAPGKLWQDVQSKIRIYLQSAGGASLHRELRFEHAIRMLHLVNRLVSVGQEFCGAASPALQESIRKQILAFFRAYHSGRMETLRMFLENEEWQPVPVKSSFSLADLHEFAPFRSRLLQAARLRQLNSTSASGEISDTASGSSSTTFFDRLDENPFEFTTEEDCVEDFFATPDAAISNNGDGSNQQAKRRSSADSEEAEDEDNDQLLRAHHIDEDTGRPVIVTSASSAVAAPPSNSSSRLNSPSVSAAVANGGRASAGIESVTSQLHRQPRPASAGPLITNTLLEVLRLLGRYTQMIHLLKPIAFDVALRMTQLAEYYIYTVYWFYARDNIELAQSCLTSKLSNCLLRIGDQLIQHARLEEDGHAASASASPSTVVSAAVQSERFLLPARPQPTRQDAASAQPRHPGQQPARLAARIVSVESTVYLAQQVESLLVPYLESQLPHEKRPFLAVFVSHTLSAVPDLRAPAACAVAATGLRLESVQAGMAQPQVNWDVREILSEHSGYVDLLLCELAKFGDCLDRAAALLSNSLPGDWANRLWHYALLIASQCLVEGFSAARRCSNEGRALMQLDFQHYLVGAERLSGLRPVPHKDYVDQFIKAYYLPESELHEWLRDRREFTARQKAGLLACLAHLSKKTRQRLLAVLDLPTGGLGALAAAAVGE
ncbi:hypothetical protein BOX15_Mlig019331g2 [Macrostomum lignano]|uniref:Uncharacterized protein n=1 Tax=Macrostomum lignano TaxID=282301 RepID=A0A267EHF4_9PLAT|nr:hypothetical protein BOX15_Mlig019331g2 [Macrostomum lignano]